LSSSPTRWLIDGMNVIGSRPTGWWRDRRGAMRELVQDLARFAAQTREPVTVVFDGRPFEAGGAPGVDVGFASRAGRDAADDEIAERVAGDTDAPGLRVVTSDRRLAGRVRQHGVTVMGAGEFRRRLEQLSGS
jgi:predicted RNA-binding protein with PIN domain